MKEMDNKSLFLRPVLCCASLVCPIIYAPRVRVRRVFGGLCVVLCAACRLPGCSFSTLHALHPPLSCTLLASGSGAATAAEAHTRTALAARGRVQLAAHWQSALQSCGAAGSGTGCCAASSPSLAKRQT
eukprot:scaffold10057_cov140-Isochrysis_galbana.AAC.6